MNTWTARRVEGPHPKDAPGVLVPPGSAWIPDPPMVGEVPTAYRMTAYADGWTLIELVPEDLIAARDSERNANSPG